MTYNEHLRGHYKTQDVNMIEIYAERKFESKSGMSALWTDGVNEFWLPYSIIVWERIKPWGKDFRIEVPEWKAKEVGII